MRSILELAVKITHHGLGVAYYIIKLFEHLDL